MKANLKKLIGAALVMGCATGAWAADDKKQDTVVIKPPPAAVKADPPQQPKRDPSGDPASIYRPKPPQFKMVEPPLPGRPNFPKRPANDPIVKPK